MMGRWKIAEAVERREEATGWGKKGGTCCCLLLGMEMRKGSGD